MSTDVASDISTCASVPCGADTCALISTAQFYEQHAKEYADRTLAADMSPLRARFLARLPAGARILDAGCGSGRDLRAFISSGYQALGIDSSSALVRIASAYSGAPCMVGRLEEMTFSHCFDGVWACASLLHLPKTSLPGALERIHAALVPGGILFASVQKGAGTSIALDGRYYAYYQLPEFKELLALARFVVEDAWENEDALRGPTQPPWLNVLARAAG